jgi:hypothetical protein
MKRILLACILALACGVVAAQPRFGLSADDYELARQWLRSSCLAPGGGDELIRRLRAKSALFQSAFSAALEQGPAEAEVAEAREGATAIYRREREALSDPVLRSAVPPDRLEALRAVSEDEFVRTEVANFVNGYRSNAMSGIAVVGDAAAIDRLREIARGPDRAAAIAAQGALALRDSLPR